MDTNQRKLVSLSAVKEEPLRWLWPDRIPLGAVALLDGDPGQSKSTLLYEIAARVTAGRPMPFCQGEAKAGGVVLLQAEDNLASTVRPALARAGADYNRVRVYDRSHFLEQPLTLPDDLPLIEEAASEVEARLVVIDPFTAFLSGNPNSEQSVRKALGPLAAFADRAGLAVVIARHLTKRGSTSPLYRGVGSIGIIALARSALWVCNDPESDDPYQHILVQTKSNLSGATSVCYRTAKSGDVVVVEWLGESKYTARDAVSDAREDRSALEEAKDALRTILVRRWLPPLLRGYGDRPIIVVADRDRQKSGKQPGAAGAYLLALYLRAALRRPVTWALPAPPHKVRDQIVSREWNKGLSNE
jgi:hypothetical protein